jgi:hypothetical protein
MTMQPDVWAKKLYDEVLSYHDGKDASLAALDFIARGKREDALAEKEAAEHQRLKAKSDADLGNAGLAKVRRDHAAYLDRQAGQLDARAAAIETLLKRSRTKKHAKH